MWVFAQMLVRFWASEYPRRGMISATYHVRSGFGQHAPYLKVGERFRCHVASLASDFHEKPSTLDHLNHWNTLMPFPKPESLGPPTLRREKTAFNCGFP